MDLKIHLIKILFISLQNYRNFSLFLFPPPEDLSELNVFDEDNTVWHFLARGNIDNNSCVCVCLPSPPPVRMCYVNLDGYGESNTSQYEYFLR